VIACLSAGYCGDGKGGMKGGAALCKKFMHGKTNSVREAARQSRIGPTRGRTGSDLACELCWNVREVS
jgi:hypothetical protein